MYGIKCLMINKGVFMSKETNKSFLSHFLVIGSGTAINMLLGLATTPIITRIVDTEEYGKLSIFNMYTSIALMVLCLGLDQALVRFYYRKEDIEYKRSLLKLCIGLPIVVSVIISVIVLLFSWFNIISFEFTFDIMFLLCINVIVSILNRISVLLLRITYQSKKFATCNILMKVTFISFALILIFTIKENYFRLLAIATIFSLLIPSLAAICFTKDLWKHSSAKLDNRNEIIRYGLPLILSMGITTLFQTIDKISLNQYCTYSEVGVYSSAMTLINIFAIIQTTFNSLWGPLQVEHYTKYPNDTKLFQRANRIITVIMFIAGISLILVKDVFALLLGEKYREAAYIIPFLIFNPVMFTISETTNSGIGKSKKSYLNIFVALGACITNIVGNMLLVPVLACKGAAISTGCSYIVFWFLRMTFSNKQFYVDYGNKKMLVLIILTSGYALYNTFVSFNVISILLYAALLAIIMIMYRNTVKEIITLGIDFLKKKAN